MPVYVIYSGMSLSAIREFLLSYGTETQLGHLRVNYDQKGYETNLSIATLDSQLYDNLVGAGFDKRKPGIDFSIVPYRLSDRNRPKENQNPSFYIPLPKELKLTENQVFSHVSDRLRKMNEFGDLPARSYRVIVPKVSRDTGELKGSCFVTFHRDTPIETIALCRSVIDGSTWVGGTECRCMWAQKREKPAPETPQQ